MSIDNSVNDILGTGGAKYFPFPTVGTKIAGEIVAATTMQERDMQTNALKYWPDDRPKMMLVVTLQTKLHEDDEDDGQRTIYAKGLMLKAVREALQAAKAKLEVGGLLGIEFTGEIPSQTKGFAPQKEFRAQYKPPVAAPISEDDLV